jgi:hypothetical protein
MAKLLRQNPLALVLAAIAALFAVVIAVEVAFNFWSTAPAPVSKAPPPSEVKLLPPLAAVVPDQAYPETAARPLFTPTRRPAPAAPTVASTMVKGQFILTGIFAVKDQRIALLKEKSSGKVHRVERGKEINGATLSTVDNERVVLTQGGDEEVLTMQVQKGPGPTAAAAASAGPFAPTGQPGAAGQAPGLPAPGAPGTPPQPAQPVPQGTPAQPAVTMQPAPAPPGANPAQRSGFGQPFVSQPATSDTGTTPMTPEELLARRRARRGTQQPNQ